jgi:hypothetical protein
VIEMKKPKKKVKKTVPSSHLLSEVINGLIEKIINEVVIEEKIRWSWGVMKECEILESAKIAKKHVAKCKNCKDFLDSRKLLAKLVIQEGRVQA